MTTWEWSPLEQQPRLESVHVFGVELKLGDRVRLRPREGGDILDIALSGQTAAIESIEQDYEDKVYLAVVLDRDPGRDLGLLRQPGHRFFFSPEEVEPLPLDDDEQGGDRIMPTILIAGIGNIFLGDDAFGVEVARQLSRRQLPESVRLVDFGIRGFDLLYALLDPYDAIILVDATPRGGAPGTLYTIEPDLSELDHPDAPETVIETHGMNPMRVLAMAKALGGQFKRLLLVGCEPATLGPEEGQMGLSQPVQAAVDKAVGLIELLVIEILATDSQQAMSCVIQMLNLRR